MQQTNLCLGPNCNKVAPIRGGYQRKFCSLQCSRNHATANAKPKKPKVEKVKKEPLTKVCTFCNNEYTKTSSDTNLTFGKRKYCSITCAQKARAIKIARNCIKCGCEFFCRPKDIQRFCSKKCGRQDKKLDDSFMSYDEIGARLNMSADQVKWIEAKALIKLKKAAENIPEILEFFSDN